MCLSFPTCTGRVTALSSLAQLFGFSGWHVRINCSFRKKQPKYTQDISSCFLQLVPLFCSSDSPEGGTEILQAFELVLPKGNKKTFSHLVLLNITNQAQLIALQYSQTSRFPEWEASDTVIEVIQILRKKTTLLSPAVDVFVIMKMEPVIFPPVDSNERDGCTVKWAKNRLPTLMTRLR